MDVCCWWALRVGVLGRSAIGGDGVRGIHDFDIKTGGEGLEVRYDQPMIRWWARGRQSRCELREAESSEDGGDIGIVGEVEVEGLV